MTDKFIAKKCKDGYCAHMKGTFAFTDATSWNKLLRNIRDCYACEKETGIYSQKIVKSSKC